MKRKPKKRKSPVFAKTYPAPSKAHSEANALLAAVMIAKPIPDPPPMIIIERAISADENGNYWKPGGDDWISYRNVTPREAYGFSVWRSDAVGDLWVSNYGRAYKFGEGPTDILVLGPFGTPRQLQEHEVLRAVQRRTGAAPVIEAAGIPGLHPG